MTSQSDAEHKLSYATYRNVAPVRTKVRFRRSEGNQGGYSTCTQKDEPINKLLHLRHR
jgi:hypothetical protein